MSTFFDCKGRDWKLSLTVGALADVRRHAGLDFGKVLRSQTDLIALLFDDPENLVKVLWVLVSARAEERKVTPEDFACGFDGPALEQATEALLQAIADFFPRSQVAKVLKAQLTERLKEMDQMVIRQMTGSTSNGSPGDSPGSAESTPPF